MAAFMAIGTGCIAMLADQRKGAQTMIKTHGECPATFVVAVCTAGAQLCTVYIVTAMAVDAGGSERHFFSGFDMAGCAFRCVVLAEQRERCPDVMVKA